MIESAGFSDNIEGYLDPFLCELRNYESITKHFISVLLRKNIASIKMETQEDIICFHYPFQIRVSGGY